MSLKQLTTSQVADAITDEVNGLIHSGALPASFNSRFSFEKILRAINEADIDVCGSLKIEKQFIVYVPSGTHEIFLRYSDQDEAGHTSAIEGLNLPASEETILLNEAFYADANQLRSQYIYLHSTYPVSGFTSGERVAILSFGKVQELKEEGDTYYDDLYGTTPVAFHEASRARIVLRNDYSSDKWATFKAYLLPEKIDYETFDADDYASYEIKTPTYAEKLLVLRALESLMPITFEARALIDNAAQREMIKVKRRMPKETTVFEVKSYIG